MPDVNEKELVERGAIPPTELKGAIRGGLDIPRYVSRRATSLSWPKTYPVLVSEESPSTPENTLTHRVLRTLLTRLNASVAPSGSAEALKVQWCRHWIANRLRRDPWRETFNTRITQRLKMETTHRIARRQTGNERAYSDLLRLIDDGDYLIWGNSEGQLTRRG